MNKNDVKVLIKILSEIDKKLIDENETYKLTKEQKEIFKIMIDDYCEDFNNKNNV